ncbi:MAG: LysM peptidoglycan-binding domain-containing protein [Bacteroidales bacterium]|nr:LysM peptidoglycan-binding domain-containing protein [Bacteroidales bacterium]
MKSKPSIGYHIIVVLFLCVVHTSLGYAQCDTTYIIQSGDNLGKIAQKFKKKYPDVDYPDYHINDDSIKEWNGLKNDSIYAGRSLTIKIPCEPNNQANETAPQEEETQGTVSGDPETSGAPSGAVPEPQERTEKSKISLWWLWLLLGGMAGVLCWEKFIRERVPHLFKSNQSKKKPATPTVSTSSLKKEIQRLQTENDSLTKENEELHKECEKFKLQLQKAYQQRNQNQNPRTSSNQSSSIRAVPPLQPAITPETVDTQATNIQTAGSPTPTSQTKTRTLYADGIVNGVFNRTKETADPDTVFILHLRTNNSARFSIYPPAQPRILANPAFLEGCEKQVLTNATRVVITTEGEAIRQADGKWQITKKLEAILNS